MQDVVLKYLLVIVVGLVVVLTVAGQTTEQDDDDLQSWNDVQVTVGVNKKVDLYLAGTAQFQTDLTQVKDGRITAGIILKPVSDVAITPFFTLLRARNSDGGFASEYRMTLRAVYRFPIERFGLSHRSQLEYRIRPNGNTWRYRPSVTFEKNLPDSLVTGLKLFVTEEPFYDSASGRFSRNRFSVGVNKTLSEKLSLDIYYLRQGDNSSNPGTVHVIGTAWKIKL